VLLRLFPDTISNVVLLLPSRRAHHQGLHIDGLADSIDGITAAGRRVRARDP